MTRICAIMQVLSRYARYNSLRSGICLHLFRVYEIDGSNVSNHPSTAEVAKSWPFSNRNFRLQGKKMDSRLLK